MAPPPAGRIAIVADCRGRAQVLRKQKTRRYRRPIAADKAF